MESDDEAILSTLNAIEGDADTPIVKDLMTKKVITVSRLNTSNQVMQKFVEKKITAAPVVDEKGRVVGLISDLDLLVIGSMNMQNKKIGELPLTIAVEKKIICVNSDDSIKEALVKIIKHRIGRVLVTDQRKKCVGIISRKDLMRYFLSRFTQK